MELKRLDDEGFARLRVAILVQAYKDLCDIKLKKRNGSEKALEDFFKSDWARDLMISDLNPETLINHANIRKEKMLKEFEEEFVNNKTACKIIFNRSLTDVEKALKKEQVLKELNKYLKTKRRNFNRVIKDKEKEEKNKEKALVITDILYKLEELMEDNQ